jgi:EAL domain-containing protein (putative c-di-GMP-specific phosphodiesterase class I)
VIAEGVEHERDVELLRELGCDVAQGYGISVPLEPDAFFEFCRSH